jgi:hypothetical protein
MNPHAILVWMGPALDALVIVGLGIISWQLRRDPGAAWNAYEAKLRELQEGLRLLVMQAEGEARELDKRLAAHAEQLRALAEIPSPAPAARRAGAPGAGEPVTPPAPSLAERVQQLAAARTPIAEIARRLALPIAEARVLAGLTTGGAAYLSAGKSAKERGA